MSDNAAPRFVRDRTRPRFPERAVVTCGMPYGNKDLHFGHVGGVFVQADTFARFLRDRIGGGNVIFVSGTDCYGSPSVEEHRQMVARGEFDGSLQDFVEINHKRQKETLYAYQIKPNLFGASSVGRPTELHREFGAFLLKTLFANGHLEKRTVPQFYDGDLQTFLNGRQVHGRCPVQGCRSENAYADECSLGHQYEPKELIDPRSVLTDKKPQMRDGTNWYVKLPEFKTVLRSWVEGLKVSDKWRPFVVSTMLEQFEPPIIHVTRDQLETLDSIADQLPSHSRREGRAKSVQLVFDRLQDMEEARAKLGEHSIRYRTGKTLVPFRLTGDLEWGLPAPEVDGLSGLTFWVWPESLWVPIPFTQAYLEQEGGSKEAWRDWWCSKNAKVYQFIGEDNINFYGLPEMAMFLGMQGTDPATDPPEGEIQLPHLVANRHVLFLDKKASSSSTVKPPMARDLLQFYTLDQLRAHFFSLGLGMRNVSFRPKPLNPQAGEKEGDPVLKEGNLLSNAFNKAVRSCFYTAQKFFDGKVPVGEVTSGVLEESETVILDYEQAMYKHEFHVVMTVVGHYVREINQRWSQYKPYNDDCDASVRRQAIIDAFHMVRVATVLLHPVAPQGTEMIREYLGIEEDLWSWNRIFEPLYEFMDNPSEHRLKFLEPRVDFFEKHPSQVRA